jgi:SAM-dependent methyltransferase
LSNFSAYVNYYDIFYNDKNYSDEASYVNQLISADSKNAVCILEIGCGTGKHAVAFAKYGYTVEAIDYSNEMINIASANLYDSNILFKHGDARVYRSDANVDVVVSLFHVFSYMTSDDDVASFIQSCYENLKTEGILIFDYWYSPAVHAIGPTQRVRKIDNDDSVIYRISDPTVFQNQSRVDVNIDIIDINKKSGSSNIISEIHPMRHFTLNEIRALVSNKFEILHNYEWMKFSDADEKSWAAVCVLRKK